MKRKNVILIHFFFWFYIINQNLFPLYMGQLEGAYKTDNKYFQDVIISIILNAISFYTVYFSFPRVLKLSNKLLAICLSIGVVVLLLAFRLPVEYYFWKFFGHLSDKEMTFTSIFVWNTLRLVIITSIYAVLIRFMINWFETQKLRDELVNQQQAGELALMRSQVNPHFLFNTLNNIYSLVYRKSDEAPAALMKLSSIMRYMLYDSASGRVPLDKEIEYLKSFIELQNLRVKHPDFVSLDIKGDAEGLFIAPMLLISFVENAFKHGSKKQHPGIIIRLVIAKESLNFEVTNYLKSASLVQDELASGIGLANISRRLELIYPGRHKLHISKEAGSFKINLEIKN